VRAAQRTFYAHKNATDIPKHLIVPKSQDCETLLFQPRGALRVAINLKRVLATIDLKDDSFVKTHEIHNIFLDRVLPAKLVTGQATAPKTMTQ